MNGDRIGRPLRIVILALVCGVAAIAGSDGGGAESQIRRLEDEWRRAQKASDTAAFMKLLSPDLTFIGTSGSLRDRAGFIASRTDSSIPRAASYEISELRVRVLEDVAVVTGREATTGSGTAFQGRFTHVWARQSGEWRLIAVQRTDIVDSK